MESSERKLWLIFGIGCLCIIGAGILLLSLWPYRVPILLFVIGLITLQVLVMLMLRVVKAVTDTVVRLHEQKIRQERLWPNDNGYYEIPLDGNKVPTFYSKTTQYQEEEEPYSQGYSPTQFHTRL